MSLGKNFGDKTRYHPEPEYGYQQKSEMGVYGYIRENMNALCNEQIPFDIIQLIAVWYGIADYWDIQNCHKQYEFIRNENAMRRIKEYVTGGLCFHIFGSVNIKIGDYKIWKLRLLQKDSICDMPYALIGIIDTNKVDPNLNGDFCDKNNGGYGITLSAGFKYFDTMQGIQYAAKFKVDDIIIMELDMTDGKNCTLSYKMKRNGLIKDYGIAFRNIDPKKQWRLAIAMYHREKIQLIQ